MRMPTTSIAIASTPNSVSGTQRFRLLPRNANSFSSTGRIPGRIAEVIQRAGNTDARSIRTCNAGGMSRPPVQLPAALGAVFSAGEARAVGVSARRLAQPDVVRIARGLYRRASHVTSQHAEPVGLGPSHPAERWRVRQRSNASALMPYLPAGAFFSRFTAAAIWGLPVPVRPEPLDHLDVATLLPLHALKLDGVLGHRVHPDHVTITLRRGMRVSDPATTWAMLAPRLTHNAGVALGDAVVRQARIPGTRRLERAPLATMGELTAMAMMRGRAGASQLRGMLPLISPHSASPPETDLRLLLRKWHAPEYELDFDVYDECGRLAGCSEVVFRAFKLALEYEGRHHLTQPHQWNRDIEKYRRYAQLGWEVIRVTAELQYRDPGELRRQVFEALRRRGWAG